VLVPAREVEVPVLTVGQDRMDEYPVVNEVRVDDLAEAMRRVARDPALAAEVGGRASRAIRGGFTWERTGAAALARLRDLTASERRRRAA